MSEETKKVTDYEEVEIEKEYIEMIEKAENAKKLTKEELETLVKQAKESTEFMKLLEGIKIPDGKHVVLTDGDVQLVYENGEFFLISTVDSTAAKKKISRKEAIDLNIEFFIRYQINPIIKAKEKGKQIRENKIVKEKSLGTKEKEIKKEEVKKQKEELVR